MGQLLQLKNSNDIFNNEIDKLTSLCHEDLESINTLILQKLDSNVPLIKEVASYLILSGGKRLRPLLTSCSFNLIKKTSDNNKEHIGLAAAVEFIHAATLLHDDVIDESKRRRGNLTANEVWGNKTSVLVGDFLFSRAFQLMTKYGNLEVLKILSDTSVTISEGEVLQLLNSHNPDINEKQYFKVIQFKTAKLFEACGSLAGISNNGSSEEIDQYSRLGLHFGIIFQLIDDILDYSGNASQIGKNIGDDLSEGKITLPLIYAIKNSTERQRNLIKDAIKIGDISRLPDVIEIIEETKSIAKVRIESEKQLENIKFILKTIPNNDFLRIIMDLAEYSVYRKN